MRRNYSRMGRRGMRHCDRFDDEHSATEKPSTKIVPPSPRGARLREELLAKIVPWEKLALSFHDFPYYVEERTKSQLVESVAPILKRNKLRKYCARLNSSSNRVLLRCIPGTALYREKLVTALAREMRVPLLKLDEDHGCDYEDDSDDEHYPCQFRGESCNKVPTFKRGDRVQYFGREISFEEVNNRSLLSGQRGEVFEVSGNTVAVAFNICALNGKETGKNEDNTELLQQALVVWLHGLCSNSLMQWKMSYRIFKFVFMTALLLEMLYGVLESQQPMIVYLADSFLWPPTLDRTNCPLLRNMFNQFPEGVVMVSSENYSQDKLEKEEAGIGQRVTCPALLQRYGKSELSRLFDNVVCIKPPKDEDLVTVISESNLKTILKVLKDHNLSCMNLEHPVIDDLILKRKKVEKIVGWAVNHHLTSCPLPHVNEEKLQIPCDCIKLAISRFMEEEDYTSRPKKKLKCIEDHDEWIVSAVVRSEDIGVKFDDVGILENVKKLLYEAVILPLRGPELFSQGHTLRVCKGILLFGPPGTGKTHVAKALATESGAHFINITAAAFKHMSFEALFSCASKLAPAIIYLDEVDSFLGARGPDKTGKNKLNDFMAAWGRWSVKNSQRILLVGATNRPFDLDEAVIRHMPRRIYVGLPDLENCSKILKLVLDKENLQPGFSFEQLAEATEGYSGSDLKNLCLAAVYGPVQEFLEQESKGEGEASNGAPALRPLNLSDFIHAKSKVRPSITYNASSTLMLREFQEEYGEGESQRQHI